MIFDLLSHQRLYRSLHPDFALSFDWLARFDPATPDGRIELAGDRVFALVQSYTTAPAAEKKFETHRNRIDIQYIARGTELMVCAPVGIMKETEAYDPAKDAAFYAEPLHALTCPLVGAPGSFAVFFPHDAHKGACIYGNPAAIKKVVIKVTVF